MVRSATISVKNDDVVLLVGTMKGLFLFRSNAARRRWDVGGPFFPGRSVYGVAYDGREGRHRICAAPASMHWGAVSRKESCAFTGRATPGAPGSR
jgi:hypothetical protein